MYVVFESEREITIFYGKYAILKANFRKFVKTFFYMSSFSPFKELADSLLYFGISSIKADILSVEEKWVVPADLAEDIRFNLIETTYNISEAAICEAIIYPIIREIWKAFRDRLSLWSHKSLSKKAKDSGIPDYIISKRSPLGKEVMDLPILVMIEAKKDDFDGGWAQCVAQLHLAQTLSKNDFRIYGIVSNGDVWQFGYLEGTILTQHIAPISIENLSKLYNTLYFIFEECVRQLDEAN
jgi:hypothetical protein